MTCTDHLFRQVAVGCSALGLRSFGARKPEKATRISRWIGQCQQRMASKGTTKIFLLENAKLSLDLKYGTLG